MAEMSKKGRKFQDMENQISTKMAKRSRKGRKSHNMENQSSTKTAKRSRKGRTPTASNNPQNYLSTESSLFSEILFSEVSSSSESINWFLVASL